MNPAHLTEETSAMRREDGKGGNGLPPVLIAGGGALSVNTPSGVQEGGDSVSPPSGVQKMITLSRAGV